MRSISRTRYGVSALVATLLLSGTALWGARGAHAAEIIPSVGITKAAHATNGKARISGGLAFRGNLIPILSTEIGVMYRSEERLGGNLDVRQWPVTASLWLQPVPQVYAGGGVGWYHTTFDYVTALGIPNETRQEFGMHVGGGVRVPLSEAAALDLNGRYVFMDSQQTVLPPTTWDPDFWTTQLGLAFRF